MPRPLRVGVAGLGLSSSAHSTVLGPAKAGKASGPLGAIQAFGNGLVPALLWTLRVWQRTRQARAWSRGRSRQG